MHSTVMLQTFESVKNTRAAIDRGELTPKFLAEQALARANSNASRNVYIAIDPQQVQLDERALQNRFAAGAKPPLFGLPVSLKDCFDLSGAITTCGSRFYAQRNTAVTRDSAVAARLREQGAIITGKTNMHPLAYGITGQNPDYGDCLQPRDARLLTGGSSSGAAASVQEGSAIAAIGTDTGGSIRAPAALCGLAGYRASIELAHERGLWRGSVHLSPTFDTLGWLFRDLRDAPLLASALFGISVPAERPQKRVRIGCVAAEFTRDCEPAVLDAFTQWQKRLRDRGAEISPVDSSFWEQSMDLYAPIQAHEAAAIHRKATGGDFSPFEKSIAERLSWGASIPANEIAQLRKRHTAFRAKMDAQLRDYDFLIAPVAPVARLVAGADHTNTRRAILRHTTPQSLGGVPIVTLPCESGAGVQLIAARGRDARLLAFAAQLADCLEG
jgi:Asp-tRNA(Asn)/Glu-tRNA(Gln) amidotransferase A subunit family amidase